MTIRSLLEQHAQEIPDAEALRSYEDKVWVSRTFAQFLSDVRQTGAAYGTAFALRPREENVALILANSPTWMDVYLACSGAGVAVVPIDPKLHNDEVAYILGDSGAVVVTTDRAHLAMMQAIVPSLPSVRGVVLVDGEGTYEPIGSVPVRALAALRAEARDTSWYDAHVAAAEDVASIIYTSGTTGKPKGAMLTHGNFTADAVGSLEGFGESVSPSDTFLVVLPLFHAFSFCTNFVVPLLTGSAMFFVRSLYTIGEDVKILRPTVVMGVPLLAEKMYDKIDAKLKASKKAQFLIKIGLKRLVYGAVKRGLGGRIRFMIVGGAPCPKHVLEGFKKLGITMLEGYGLTECSPVVSIAGPKCARLAQRRRHGRGLRRGMAQDGRPCVGGRRRAYYDPWSQEGAHRQPRRQEHLPGGGREPHRGRPRGGGLRGGGLHNRRRAGREGGVRGASKHGPAQGAQRREGRGVGGGGEDRAGACSCAVPRTRRLQARAENRHFEGAARAHVHPESPPRGVQGYVG